MGIHTPNVAHRMGFLWCIFNGQGTARHSQVLNSSVLWHPEGNSTGRCCSHAVVQGQNAALWLQLNPSATFRSRINSWGYFMLRQCGWSIAILIWNLGGDSYLSHSPRDLLVSGRHITSPHHFTRSLHQITSPNHSTRSLHHITSPLFHLPFHPWTAVLGTRKAH